jgi:coenzyme F420-reducing hydrogenase gamma subunit
MKYLGIEPKKPKVAVFDFTGCEGCQLQLANKEETLADFLQSLEIVNFREISSAASDDYDIAIIDGAVTRNDEVQRIKKIRKQARYLIAAGACSCFGGVNRLKNAVPLSEANKEVYGDMPQDTRKVQSIKEVVPVDMEIPGCPISKAEVERVVQHLIWEVPYHFPAYPVCFECKQRFITCLFDKGQLCLGPVTCGGCEAPCPAGGLACMGCRGPAQAPNYSEFIDLARERGYLDHEIQERLDFFGGFAEVKVR